MADPLDIACPECGQLHVYRRLPGSKTARCVRCSAILYRNRPHMLENVLALVFAALVLFLLSNLFPLLALRTQGVELELHLFAASVELWHQGYQLLALLISLNTIIFPLFELLSLLVVLLTIRFAWTPEPAIFLFRWMRELKPWGMLEVFMLGILVAVVKLGDMATLIVDTAFWSFAGFIVVMAAANATLDPFSVWRELRHLRGESYAST